jgi:hypothetical protein
MCTAATKTEQKSWRLDCQRGSSAQSMQIHQKASLIHKHDISTNLALKHTKKELRKNP